MATFEFNNTAPQAQETRVASAALDPRRLREECIIAFKVYDACRQPDCKTLHRHSGDRASWRCTNSI
jgi:hypothetical protein